MTTEATPSTTAPLDVDPGRPLQVVELDTANRRVVINEDSLGRIEKNLVQSKAQRIAIVSIMGAFRGGKSFMLDLMLRYLNYTEAHPEEMQRENVGTIPARGGTDEYPIPQWLAEAGASVSEGSSASDESGFRWRGGMEKCTQGIWMWSKPYVRIINRKRVALLLMDTQGAWDSKMSKEQSATMFGLTTLFSSKQIYNVSKQIQENTVENLSFFVHFAQECMRKAGEGIGEAATTEEVEAQPKPFQNLEFLVRDWCHYEDDWGVEQCQKLMKEHLDTHMDPTQVVENSTVQALQDMFERISCWCLPHPGMLIEKASWSGNIENIDKDFIRFLDMYMPQIFSETLTPKAICGQVITPKTFAQCMRHFTAAFSEASPNALTYTEATKQLTVLLAKDAAVRGYKDRMVKLLRANPKGYGEEQLKEEAKKVQAAVLEEYAKATIFGSEEEKKEAREAVTSEMSALFSRYEEDNKRALERCLVSFSGLLLTAVLLFILDRITDYTCDWWSDTCVQFSKLFFFVYCCGFLVIGYNVYILYRERGQLAVACAGGELWKESYKKLFAHVEEVKKMDTAECKRIATSTAQALKEIDPEKVKGGVRRLSERAKTSIETVRKLHEKKTM